MAATCTFASVGNNYWNTAVNWSCGHVPTINDSVIIPAGTSTRLFGGLDDVATAGDVAIGASSTLDLDDGTLDVSGDWSNEGNLSGGSGDVIFSGTSTQTVGPETSFPSLTINTTSSVVLSGNITVLGDFEVTNGSLEAAGNNLLVMGTSTISSGTTVTSTSGTLTFTGPVTNAGSIGSISGNKLFSSTLANSGTLNVGSGVTTSTGNLTNTGTVNGNTGRLALVANYSGGSTFNGDTGTVRLYGGAAQSIKGEAFYNLEVNKSSGIATLTANATTTGSFNVINGTLAIGAYNLKTGSAYTNTGSITRTTGHILHTVESYNFTNSSWVTQTGYTAPVLVYLQVQDANRNMDGTSIETIALPITTAGGDSETITLTETGIATGIFRSAGTGLYTGTPLPGNGELEVASTKTGTETYTDNQDSSDTGATTATFAYPSSSQQQGGGGGNTGSNNSNYLNTNTNYQSYNNDPNRGTNLKNLSSFSIDIHALVKLPDDGNPATQVDSAVYYIGADGKRHAFPNDKAFFTWYKDFSNIKEITPDKLAAIPLGANAPYKPGTKMIKFTTAPQVYAVGLGGTLRWIKTENAAAALYGNTWNKQIDDVSDAFFVNYAFGQDISSPSDFNVSTQTKAAETISADLGL